ncbi:MAG TPA: hypothetical protein DCZ75_11210 [Geobacter sp.]|nr:hypothetical protein [Geobacter sp.]
MVGLCLGSYVLAAAGFLETTAKPLYQVAQEAGFGSEASLRLHFGKAFRTLTRQVPQGVRGE